jgi:hypothetical protein
VAVSNDRLLEGLYNLGYPVDLLARLQGEKGKNGDEFRWALRNAGINDADIKKGEQLAEYRKGDKPSKTALYEMMGIMGVRPETQRAIQYAGDDKNKVYQALVKELGEERAGALAIKAWGPTGVPKGTVWNPFRGDQPPSQATVKHGAMGAITSYIPPGMSAIEPPTPQVAVPGAWSANERAGVPPKPGTGMTKPGAPAPPSGLPPDTLPGAGGPGGGTPPPVDNRPVWQKEGRKPTPEEFDAYVRQNFGYQAWWVDVPEIRNVLFEMTEQGLSDPSEAQRRVSETSWWKNTSAAARTWWANEKADPASSRASIAEQTATFTDLANEMGVEIDPARLGAIAEASLRFGWNQAQIKRAIGNEYEYDPNNRLQGAKVSEMKALASKYLVPMSDETIGSWAKGLITGDYSDDEFKEYLKQSAKSMFPQLTAALDAGHTVEEYVNPYKQMAAQRLEIPPDQINFMDPKWRAALQVPDSKTGQPRVMTLTEWEAHIKTDAQYGYDKTQQGVGEAAKLAEELARKFGQVA